MTVMLDPTPENKALAGAVHSRINADSKIIAAKAAMYRLGGVGLVALLVGLGVGAAFYGYSYVHEPRTSAEKLTNAMVAALEKATLKTTGEVAIKDPTVKLDPDAQVTLAPGATIEARGQVSLDPNAKVDVRGLQPQVTRPSPRQLEGTSPQKPSATVVTNFTVFKYIPHNEGRVVTGWKFSDSEQAEPSHQYCYYLENVENGVDVKMDLAVDGDVLPAKPSSRFDFATAASHCTWFDGQSTRQRQQTGKTF